MRAWFLKQLGLSSRDKGYQTVRYAFPLFLMSIILAGLASLASQDISYISIVSSESSVTEGGAFFIDIRVNAHVPINAVDLTIAYPESQMVVEGIDTGTSVITLWAENPYAKDGKIYLKGGVFQRGFLGEHTIARIRAKAIASGVANISMDNVMLIAGDGKGTEVATENIGTKEIRMYINANDGNLEGEARIQIITDLDGDGAVNLKDVSSFMAAWFTRGKTFDFNGDGRMTFTDFSILLADSFNK